MFKTARELKLEINVVINKKIIVLFLLRLLIPTLVVLECIVFGPSRKSKTLVKLSLDNNWVYQLKRVLVRIFVALLCLTLWKDLKIYVVLFVIGGSCSERNSLLKTDMVWSNSLQVGTTNNYIFDENQYCLPRSGSYLVEHFDTIMRYTHRILFKSADNWWTYFICEPIKFNAFRTTAYWWTNHKEVLQMLSSFIPKQQASDPEIV